MVLRQPAVLLLDEATSAIDPSTQEKAHMDGHSDGLKSTDFTIQKLRDLKK